MRDTCFHPCCEKGPAPCPPPPAGGYLMQQIIAAGRTYLRYERFCLPLSGVPCDARPPLRLTGVWAENCGIRAERCGDSCRSGLSLRVEIPLTCQAADACGNCFCLSSHIETSLRLRTCAPGDAERAQPAVNAFVRLARPCECGCPDRLEAWLDVCVEAWLTAYRPLYGGSCPPPCPPPLPLYPPPCRPR